MRIAISGSHSLGKSTVVNDWVAKHPGFTREEEPYRALSLHGPYEILFRDQSTKLHNGIQLYYNISRVHRYCASSDDVIFDRAPVDYIAYSQYTANKGSSDINDAFVPKSQEWPVQMQADGIRPIDHEYRDEVDAIFKQIYREGRFGVIPHKNPPHYVELFGARQQRLDQLQQAIDEVQSGKRRAQ